MKSLAGKKVAIIIVSYNAKFFMQCCIEGIRKYADCDYRIIVVDNASTDGVREFLREQDDIILINKVYINNFIT